MESDVKTSAHSLIDLLPDNATWEDLQYLIYVRQQVDAGLADAEQGRLVDTSEIRRRLEEHRRLRHGNPT